MSTGKLMSLDDWRKARFLGKPPGRSTVRRWCNDGTIPAKRIGGNWYIDVDAERNQTGNDLADDVLKNMESA
ncbi:helix-turn-helix domain-containing protein [Salinicola peritrichatus]|uniref:helix-turn-helix domain-containing protein n=1 Tax=Salinicola peritrichatus TaxID=1267424 RepID=UPI000DA2108C|nr:helix-turn-helix domain-containing protein [Salinicola peritrichatus]